MNYNLGCVQAKFLRTYHPDIDIPFDLIKDELEYDDKFNYGRANLDSFMGNIISATYCNEGIKKRAIALAFPTGVLNRDLSMFFILWHPIYDFTPHTCTRYITYKPKAELSHISAENSAIVDIRYTHFPNCYFSTSHQHGREERYLFLSFMLYPTLTDILLGYYIAVRTFGLISLFDVQNRMTSVADSRKPPFAISELMSVRSSTDKLDGRVMDMSFSASHPSDLFLVTDQGVGYRSSFRSERKHM